jgi:hypothetical protein
MVGNINEWVADWVPKSTFCPGWGSFSDDFMCLAGADATSGPDALIRGGNRLFGAVAGVFTVGGHKPSESNNVIGFRAAR